MVIIIEKLNAKPKNIDPSLYSLNATLLLPLL
jgi:hypothetical protein